MVFPVVMYGCKGWTVKKAEHRKIDAFELWCWRRLLRVPLDYKEVQPVHSKGDQSWVFIGRTDAKAETQYFGHLMWRTDTLKRPWIWEGLKAGGEGEDRGWDVWMASPIQWTWIWEHSGSWWWTGWPGILWFMGLQRVRCNWVIKLNWMGHNYRIFSEP